MSARPDYRNEHRADARVEQLRIPPQSVEAEQAVLGGLMLVPDAYDRIADLLVPDDFYRRDHQMHADAETTVKVVIEGEVA